MLRDLMYHSVTTLINVLQILATYQYFQRPTGLYGTFLSVAVKFSRKTVVLKEIKYFPASIFWSSGRLLKKTQMHCKVLAIK